MSVTVDAKLDPPERRGKQLVVHGTVTVKNTSSVRVNVLGSSLIVSGREVTQTARSEEEFERNARAADAAGVEAANWYKSAPPEVVSRGRLVPDGFYFDAGETMTRPVIAWVPAPPVRRFDAARVDVQLVIARATVGDAESVEHQRTADATVVTRPIPEDGWLRSLTRGDRYVVTSYSDEPWAPNLEFQPVDVQFGRTRSPDVPDDFSKRMKRFYGVNFINGGAVVSTGGD